ncbi:GtrA family protein [Flagellatimonas centrodinii]|uniref:GtrA family protein n=1 Tax=Flagellatimonas centrodinii TaxID=2806210 RepID=UPI001FED9317|nr:GtrA family protein [Flagellatimonas centrodinii]ULQ46832.1 GtrA family protein [Flagellatimonas centrodinii]
MRSLKRFLMVGATATAAHYLVLTALVEGGALQAVPATIAGFLTGAVIGYACNRRFTFDSHRPHREGVPRFVLMLAVGCLLNALVMALLVHGVGWHYLPAQVIATGLVLVVNYLSLRYWVFPAPGDHGHA